MEFKKTTEIWHTIHWDFNHGMNGSFTQVCRNWCRDYCKQSLERFGRKQRWQELELPVVPLSERNSASRTGQSRTKSGKKEAGNKKRKMEYWSTIPRVVMMTFHPWKERLTIQCNSLFTHATSRSDKNSLKHVRETKNVKKKSNN